MIKRLAFILTIITAQLSAQQVSFTLSLFYDVDQIWSQRNERRLDSFAVELKEKQYEVSITGFADFLSDASYNEKLSQRRVNKVRDHLMRKKGFKIISASWLGEKQSNDNGTAAGEPSQRRVDISANLVQARQREPVTPRETHTVPPPAEKPAKKEEPAINDISGLKDREIISLKGVQFQPGRHVMVQSSIPVLKELLAALNADPDLRIEIQGHICCVDDGEDGLDYDTNEKKLSLNRAKAVYDYLVKNGIDAKRLRYKGFARTKPLVEERTPADEQKNRRVEIMVIRD